MGKKLKVEKQAWFKRLPPERQKEVLDRAQTMKATYPDRKADEDAFLHSISSD